MHNLVPLPSLAHFGGLESHKEELLKMRPQSALQHYANEALLADYLENAHLILGVMGVETCVFNAAHKISGGASPMTDGVWLWRLDAAHYVRNHHLLLSPEFVMHVERNSFDVPTVTNRTLLELQKQIWPLD